MSALTLLLALAFSAQAHAAATVGTGNGVANDRVRVAPLMDGERCIGVRVTSGQKRVADLRLGPRGVITASKVAASTDGASAVLHLAGLTVPGGAVRFTPDSSVTVRVTADSAFPVIAFDLGIAAFDASAWQKLTGGTLPFHFLVCDLPDATMFYQGGGMIPMPVVDPFPFTATGFMAGEWAKGWSYAPPIAAWAVPAVGLWNDRAATFVAYDFDEQRHTDRSGEFVASAGCVGNGGAPFFCLVHPYQRQFVKLTYPRVPSRAASHFELIYSFDVPSAKDPNQFVLERLWREKRALLPPVPRMNDLAWIPEYDGFAPSGGIEPTATGVNLIWTSGTTGLDGAFLEPGSRMIGNDFIADGILRARTLGSPDALQLLQHDVDYLMDHCTWVDVGGDRCATWIHPIEGKFRDMWGGERCAGNHHPSTFQIGAGMLLLYQTTKDRRLLPYIDGVYNWCRHYLFTRDGVCDLSWAMFSREATAVGENFLLNYRKVFRDDQVRSRHADEALEMARTAIYKNLWFYTADPDPSDDLDPTFLNQATNDCRWAGRVTWNEAGWVLRSMVPVYCETGDPFLKYLLRGSIERYYAGFRDDGGVAENLQILGEIEGKGLRTGGFPDPEHGDSVRRWARPLAPAKLRVAMGQKAAIAFCLGTRSYDVAEFRYAAPASFSFRVVGLPTATPGEALDLVATAPFRDLRGGPVSVNVHPLAADRYEFNAATAGEDVFITGVKPGDVVSIGDAPLYRGSSRRWHTLPRRARACEVALADRRSASLVRHVAEDGLVAGRIVVRSCAGAPGSLAHPRRLGRPRDQRGQERRPRRHGRGRQARHRGLRGLRSYARRDRLHASHRQAAPCPRWRRAALGRRRRRPSLRPHQRLPAAQVRHVPRGCRSERPTDGRFGNRRRRNVACAHPRRSLFARRHLRAVAGEGNGLPLGRGTHGPVLPGAGRAVPRRPPLGRRHDPALALPPHVPSRGDGPRGLHPERAAGLRATSPPGRPHRHGAPLIPARRRGHARS